MKFIPDTNLRLHRLAATALAGVALGVATAASAQVGVNVQVGQPGFYGQIQIGNMQPQVVYQQPMIIQRPVAAAPMQPVYLRVPPGHQKKWAKHCAKYNACGQPVYFVRDDWYQRVYAPTVIQQRPVMVQQPMVVQQPVVMQPAYRGEHRGRGHDDDHPGRGKGRGHGKHGD